MKNFLIHQFTYRTTKHTHVGQPHELMGNGIVRGDCIGSFLGIKVYLSDRCYDNEKTEPFMLIIKNKYSVVLTDKTNDTFQN